MYKNASSGVWKVTNVSYPPYYRVKDVGSSGVKARINKKVLTWERFPRLIQLAVVVASEFVDAQGCIVRMPIGHAYKFLYALGFTRSLYTKE